MPQDNQRDETTGRYCGEPKDRKFGEDKSMNITTVRLTADALVCATPCRLYGLEMTSKSGGTGRAVVYNGRNDNGEAMVDLWGTQAVPDIRRYNPPIVMTRGIYVDFQTLANTILVRYAA